MRRLSFDIIILCSLILNACQKNEMSIDRNSVDGTVKYAVSLGQSAQTKAADKYEDEEVCEKAETQIVLTDASGIISIPMECETTEGISTRIASDKAATITTKGTQVNTTGDDYKTLETFADIVGTFYANAYDINGIEKFTQTVTWSSSSSAWVATPTKYWPQGTSLNFLAYANLPSGQTANITSTGVSTSHTVPDNACDQKDILFGHYQGNGGNTGTAEIRFEHPLTAVRFKYGTIEGSPDIQSISIDGVAGSGTATMAPDGEISWSDVDSHDYTVSQSDDSGLSVDATTSVIGEPFLIIPQNLAAHNVTVTVTFTDGTVLKGTLTSGEWKAGYTNTYRLSASSTIVEVDVDDRVSGNVKDELVVANTGTADAYLRVAVVGFWIDAEGNIVSGWDETQGTFSADFPGTDWVKGTEDGYYYYTYPVKGSADGLPVETGTKLFTDYTAPDPPVDGAALELDIIVQGVKYDRSKSYVTLAWGEAIAGLLNDFTNE